MQPCRSRSYVVGSDGPPKNVAFGGRADCQWLSHCAETSTAAFSAVAWGRARANCVHPKTAATQLILTAMAFERGGVEGAPN